MIPHGKIGVQELNDLIHRGDDVLLLNVLPEEKFAEGHIGGSENIPGDHADFPSEVEALAGGKGRHIVVYCGGGKESRGAAEALEHAGYTHIDHFEGGMAEWKQRGLPVETGVHTSSQR